MMPFVVFVWTANAPTQMSFYFVISAILLYIKSVMEYLTFQKVKEQKYFQINKYCFIMVGWLLRFEFQLPHPTLSPALATDEKWPLNQFHISYQNSEISWPKAPISDISQFAMSKIIRIFLILFSLQNIIFWAHFLLLKFLKKIKHYLGPFFVWFLSFDRRYRSFFISGQSCA